MYCVRIFPDLIDVQDPNMVIESNVKDASYETFIRIIQGSPETAKIDAAIHQTSGNLVRISRQGFPYRGYHRT